MIHLRLVLTFAFLGAFLIGCSTPQYVPFPSQSVRIEDPSKARIYVVRPPVYGGSAIKMKIYDDGELIGKTRSAGYLCWEREPGDTVIMGKASNKSKLPLSVEAGEVYYVGQVVLPGIPYARNKLKELSPKNGKRRLKVCIAPHER